VGWQQSVPLKRGHHDGVGWFSDGIDLPDKSNNNTNNVHYQHVMKLPEDLSESLGQNLSSLVTTINFIKKRNFKIKYKMPYCLIISL